MNIVLEYINYWWKAKDRHGIHSPFVYNFSANCLRTAIDDEFERKRKELYKFLSRQEKIIERIDLGIGSKHHGSRASIKSIFSSSSSKGKTADLLYRLAKHYQPKNVLEFGTNLGVGTFHLAIGNPNSHVTSIEGCPNTAAIAQKNLENMDCANTTIHINDFTSFLKTNLQTFDMIFIDGHHDGIALMNYMNCLIPFIHDETIILVDDIRWSNSMLNAWNQLKADPNYHLTIDLFRCGLLMKRTHQQKEHFVVWY